MLQYSIDYCALFGPVTKAVLPISMESPREIQQLNNQHQL